MQTPSLTHRAHPGAHRPGASLIRQRAASAAAPRAPIARAAQWGGFWDPESNINKAVFQHPQLPAIDNIAPGDARCAKWAGNAAWRSSLLIPASTLARGAPARPCRDALEACTGLEGEAKNACYCLFGCDPKGVEGEGGRGGWGREAAGWLAALLAGAGAAVSEWEPPAALPPTTTVWWLAAPCRAAAT